jgi:methylenetetrahydrofolate reductase (NADPH)
MQVSEHLAKAKETLASFEVLPPLKGRTISYIYDHLDPLMEFKPSWINVTYHRSETLIRKNAAGVEERVDLRKRPGTVGICAAIMNHYNVDAVPHMICGGFSKRETEDALIDLQFLGIDNVLVLRGDAEKGQKTFVPEPNGNQQAIDLLKQVVGLNNGEYLDKEIVNGSKTNFCMGVAGYPEKHFEAPSMEFDLQRAKDKVDAGAQYIMTQMFFNNKKYFEYVDACRSIGITVPIIPGLKPITNKKQLTILPNIFYVDIPADLRNAMQAATTDEACEQVGTEWLIQQSKELKAAGVPVLHYYTLGKPKVIKDVCMNVF